MQARQRKAIIIRTKTEIEELTGRFSTANQADFFIKQQRENLQSKKSFLSGKLRKAILENKAVLKDKVGSGEFDDYRKEHDRYQLALEKIQNRAATFLKTQVIESQYVPSFIFAPEDIVIVLGPDGLVANSAKYLKNNPIIGINPEPERFDGVLLPFYEDNFDRALEAVVKENYRFKQVTLGEALLDDGQRLLAFNDFFIGANSHISAKYQITHEGFTENHSSSGIIISTGAGSTAWLSSLFNMAHCMNKVFGQSQSLQKPPQPWDSDWLTFVVREPFLSKTSQIELGAGVIKSGQELVIESLMPSNGLIFSDGILNDFIRFDAGAIVRIGLAPEQARLVMPD